MRSLDTMTGSASAENTRTAETAPGAATGFETGGVDDDSGASVIQLNPDAPIDSEMLQRLADAGADLTQSRRIAHFLYVGGRAAADDLAADITAAGFSPTVWPPNAVANEWTVVAELRDAIVTADTIARDDELFVAMAQRHGGRYDGWEATV